jgi:hypothetical protein
MITMNAHVFRKRKDVPLHLCFVVPQSWLAEIELDEILFETHA